MVGAGLSARNGAGWLLGRRGKRVRGVPGYVLRVVFWGRVRRMGEDDEVGMRDDWT